MRKCRHDVRFPLDVIGDVNPYCSGCTAPQKGIKAPLTTKEYEADEIKGFNCCPICSSHSFNYESEEKYWCDNCGFCESDIV